LNANPATATLAWPGPADGFHLYSTTNLAGAGWLRATNAVVEENGNLQVSLPLDGANQFFRLSSP
jgi:hypothetical protein